MKTSINYVFFTRQFDIVVFNVNPHIMTDIVKEKIVISFLLLYLIYSILFLLMISGTLAKEGGFVCVSEPGLFLCIVLAKAESRLVSR